MQNGTDEGKARVGVSVTSEMFSAVAIDRGAKVLRSADRHIERDGGSVNELVEFVRGFAAEIGSVEVFGLAMPGLVSRKTDQVTYSAGMPQYAGVDLVNAIREGVGARCVVENDANAAAFGEFTAGAGRGSKNIFYVTLGEGVGGAFVLNGELWRGTSGFAGEFGYVAIDSEGMRLEDVASSGNIVRRSRSRIHQDSTSALSRLAESDITVNKIVDAALNGDDLAILMLERTGDYVGTAVASVINLTNVERIIIGGDIMRGGELILDPIRERAGELSFGPSFADTAIVAGELGGLAPAIGAAIVASHV